MDIEFSKITRNKKKNPHHDGRFPDDREVSTQPRSFLNIWEKIPSYKDINILYGILRIIFLGGIIGILMGTTYFSTLNFWVSITIPLVLGISFIIAFSDNFFVFDGFANRSYGKLDLFEKYEFWKMSGDQFTLYLSNKRDLLHTGIRVYKIAVIPENVRPNLNHLIKSLYNAQIPFTYQIVQNPLYRDQSQTTRIDLYFTLSYYVSNTLSKTKLIQIQEALEEFSYTFKSICIANLAHFKINLLKGNDLFQAIQTFVFGIPITSLKGSQNTPSKPNNSFLYLIKAIMVLTILFYLDFILTSYFDFLVILIINAVFICLIFAFYWREVIYHLSELILLREGREEIPYFHDLAFYRLPEFRDFIFLYLHNRYLIGISMLNLNYITPPQFSADGYFLDHPDKFFRSVVNRQIPYTYTLINSPLDYSNFEKVSLKYLTAFTRDRLLQRDTEHEREEWLHMRGGIWRMSQIISLQEVKYTKVLSQDHFEGISEALLRREKEFLNIYKANFPNYHLKVLPSRRSISALIATMLKSKFYRLSGTHLDYSIIQGKTLVNLNEIANEFKKGVETRIAAEFNSPLDIQNDIVIGNTINTEFLEEEIPAGFTIDQVKNLLITNGTAKDRENILLVLTKELVKAEQPSVIFDFSGSSSKLLTYFEGTIYESHLRHYKLGRTFQIDPIATDIRNDRYDDKYDDLLIDAWAMSFKENERATQTFKSYIKKMRKTGHTSLSDIALEIETSKEWQKSPYADSILSMLKEFTEDAIYIPDVDEERMELETLPKDLVQNEKTIIIDLSILRDLEQKVFITAVMLAKIIHHIEQYGQYTEKVFIFPNADIFFDNWYLDRFNHLRYGKVNKFLEPLIQRNFGFTITANQIRYLHPNALNYFRNIISFRAIDKRDISSLQTIMNLSELHGTGYYSNSRKDSYQVDFLINLKENEALVRRADYNQPYPIEVLSDIINIPIMEFDYIKEYMARCGLNLQDTENRILLGAKKTLFETHFQNYIIFLEEIIKFFNVLGRLDKVGNLYKAKIKEQLLKLIYTKAQEKFQNDTLMIKEVRDRLFDMLLKYNYIIEDHPRRASGSQSIRTSYSVGPQYQESLDDYYRAKDSTPLKVSVETIDKESDLNYELEALFPSYDETKNEDIVAINSDWENSDKVFDSKFDKKELEETFRNLLMKEFFFDLTRINFHLKKENYEEALFLEREILRSFLVKFYCEFHKNESCKISDTQTQKALEFLDQSLDLPVSTKEFMDHLDLSKLGALDQKQRIERIIYNFDTLLQVFHTLHDYFIAKDNGGKL